MQERYHANTIINGEVKSNNNVIILEGDNMLDEFSLSNYHSMMNLCNYNLFDKKSLHDNAVCNFATNVNIVSDIVFGIANGLYE